jgi:hypothetical protein
MSTGTTNYLSKLKALDEDFQNSIILGIIFVFVITFICYVIYIRRLKNSGSDYMNDMYSSVNGYVRSVSSSDPDCSGNLFDYYIKTAYNACSGGSYKNDFVSKDVLKSIIRQGVRCLDFEVYSIDNSPVVATSTKDDYYVKETFNSVKFSEVMETINNYAFSGGTAPNPTDPILIHLRIKSNNQEMYTSLANIFKSYDTRMLGKEYSYENAGQNMGGIPLLDLQNKIMVIVDKTNDAFLQNEMFLEYVNLTSNSAFMRCMDYYDVKNNPDTQELTEYNRRNITMVMPDNGINPENPSSTLCRTYGCQMVAMRYQYVDNYLLENTMFFDRSGYAFALKPLALRYNPVTIAEPTPQNPAYSYETRSAETDYYSFKF